MFSIPPGVRQVHDYTVYRFEYEGKEPNYRCFSYDGPSKNQWLISTPIQEVEHIIDDQEETLFRTQSGSVYYAAGYSNIGIPEYLYGSILNRYNAYIAVRLSVDEWKELAKSMIVEEDNENV